MQSNGTPEGTRRILEICQGLRDKPESCTGCAEFDAVCSTDYTLQSDEAEGS